MKLKNRVEWVGRVWLAYQAGRSSPLMVQITKSQTIRATVALVLNRRMYTVDWFGDYKLTDNVASTAGEHLYIKGTRYFVATARETR